MLTYGIFQESEFVKLQKTTELLLRQQPVSCWFASSYSLALDGFGWRSFSFIAKPMFPASFTFPWKKAWNRCAKITRTDKRWSYIFSHSWLGQTCLLPPSSPKSMTAVDLIWQFPQALLSVSPINSVEGWENDHQNNGHDDAGGIQQSRTDLQCQNEQIA